MIRFSRFSALQSLFPHHNLSFVKKMLNKICNNHSGTALLTAMLIMGVLIAISIALSSLVIREVRVTRELMDAGKAFYAAESGVEEALYYLNNKLPGWSEPGEGEFDNANFKYSIKNRCKSYPCIDNEEYDVGSVNDDMSAFYDVMELNESVLIPLFVVEKDDTGAEVIKSVKNFTVEFYGGFDPFTELKIQDVSGWDILRWKVFGMKKDSQDYNTDSISDFTAFVTNSSGTAFADAEAPSWFGTIDCDASEVSGHRITDGIECRDYVPYQVGDCNASLQARDYYGMDADGNITNTGCKNISEFVTDHQVGALAGKATGLNYLSLTNIMNPAMFDESVYGTIAAREKASRIYFRVETYGDETVREVAEIVSDGYAGDSKQSIKVMKKRDSYMPVFNFSIYSTYGSQGQDESGSDYYYDNRPK